MFFCDFRKSPDRWAFRHLLMISEMGIVQRRGPSCFLNLGEVEVGGNLCFFYYLEQWVSLLVFKDI